MRFIEKVGGSNYYLCNEPMGGAGDPADHPNNRHSIREMRGGHECGSCAISYPGQDPRDEYFAKYAPRVTALCKRLMREWQAKSAGVPAPEGR